MHRVSLSLTMQPTVIIMTIDTAYLFMIIHFGAVLYSGRLATLFPSSLAYCFEFLIDCRTEIDKGLLICSIYFELIEH